MSASAAIYGLGGLELTPDERAFFREADPWGFIVFARNIADKAQLSRLCMNLRDCVGRDAPILVDQEGGRVRRLRPPTWSDFPAAERFADLFARDEEKGIEACRLNHRLMAHELREVGLTVDCAPMLDLRFEGAHDIVGDRSFGATVEQVAALGRAAMEGLVEGGVAPIIKHIPGHGRALADSHLELPRVSVSREELIETDFAPFKALNDAVMAMSAHIVFEDIEPDAPATIAPSVIEGVIRGDIGFDGLLMTDDLSMKALGGAMRDRGEASIRAGCDMLLHCNGEMDEMSAVAEAAPELTGKAGERAEKADPSGWAISEFDPRAAKARLDELMEAAGA
jgi:beta-N-acetylhexosaminidase